MLKILLRKCRVSRNNVQLLNIPYQGKLLRAIFLSGKIFIGGNFHHLVKTSSLFPDEVFPNKVLNRIYLMTKASMKLLMNPMTKLNKTNKNCQKAPNLNQIRELHQP